MSVLEVAGVVLGVMPMLQISLEDFNERFRILVKYRQIIANIARKLDLEHAQFQSTCEKLLSPLVDEDRLAELLANPKASKWKDPILEDNLKENLGPKKYNLYMGTVKELANSIISLQDDLGLTDLVGGLPHSKRS
jgi:hypothetical protein